MVRSLELLAVGLLLLGGMARAATAQPAPVPAAIVPAAPDRPVEVELRTAARAVAPGDTVPVAIRLRPDPGWHSYWRHAGDVGSAPVVTWRLPDGFTASPLRWPAPELIEAPPLASYGYEREVHLLGSIQVPPSARVGSAVTLAATVTWVVCEIECVAGDVDLALTLPVAATSAVDPDVARAFAAEDARVPRRQAGWTFRAAVDSAEVLLYVRPPVDHPALDDADSARVHFFSDSAGLIDHAARPIVRVDDEGMLLRMARSMYASGTPSVITGVVTMVGGDGNTPGLAVEVVAPVVTAAQLASLASPASTTSAGGWAAVTTAGLLALLGGTLLNLMPCVLPVLSIKAFGLAEAAAHDRRSARRHVLLFGAGVLASMWALVGVLLVLRAAGAEVGWGYQLQSPAVVGALALLIFAAALNMAGVFELAPVGGGLAASTSRAPRAAEPFLGGVLVTALATPCSAPFLAAAVAFGLTAGALQAFVVFTALGLGLVWPLALVAASPRLRGWLPKPGAWMVTLRQLLAFPLFATVVWLAWVRGRQAGVDALVTLLVALTVLAFGLWVLGRFGTLAAPASRRRLAQAVAAGMGAAALALVLRGAGTSTGSAAAPLAISEATGVPATSAAGALPWQPFSDARLEALRDSGRMVLLDFTADWCLTCKVNERVAFGSASVREALRKHDVALLRADWTTRDSLVTRALAAFGRNSVPFVVLYQRDGAAEPIILPTLLTPGIVTAALDQAATGSAADAPGAVATTPSPSSEITP